MGEGAGASRRVRRADRRGCRRPSRRRFERDAAWLCGAGRVHVHGAVPSHSPLVEQDVRRRRAGSDEKGVRHGKRPLRTRRLRTRRLTGPCNKRGTHRLLSKRLKKGERCPSESTLAPGVGFACPRLDCTSPPPPPPFPPVHNVGREYCNTCREARIPSNRAIQRRDVRRPADIACPSCSAFVCGVRPVPSHDAGGCGAALHPDRRARHTPPYLNPRYVRLFQPATPP